MNQETKLRELLAHQHQHFNETGTMYVDDGELQCSLCGCDFRRDSADTLLSKITGYNLKVYESRTRTT